MDTRKFLLLTSAILIGWAIYLGMRLETKSQATLVGPQISAHVSGLPGHEIVNIDLSVTRLSDQESTHVLVEVSSEKEASPDGNVASTLPAATSCNPGSGCLVISSLVLYPDQDGAIDRSYSLALPDGYSILKISASDCFPKSFDDRLGLHDRGACTSESSQIVESLAPSPPTSATTS